MASGHTELIERLLGNYTSADDGMASDGLRMGLMMSKFGTALTPTGRAPVMVQAACAKYQCKSDRTQLLRAMTLATAFWALQSLAKNDDGINKALERFFTHDPRLKRIFTIEQTAFGNYQVALTAIITLNNPTPEQERAYEAMNKSASIYENLGSANEAFAPLAALKK